MAVILFILSFITWLGFSYLIIRESLLPINYRYIYLITSFLLYAIVQIFIILSKKYGAMLIMCMILLLLMGLVQAAGFMYISKGLSTVDGINDSQNADFISYSFIVKKDSDIKSVRELDGIQVSAALERDSDHIFDFVKVFDKENDFNLDLVDDGDYVSIARDLLSEEYQVMLLNESYRGLIEQEIEGFSEQTRVLDSTLVETEDTSVEAKLVEQNESFTVYVSGIDTFGPVSSRGRSDVNLILNINPNTKKILITSTPRDSYLPIAGGGMNQMDKLTHAGIYGVESSIKTLENLYDIEIHYYARVNFSSLEKMVDALGGIEVYNKQSFRPNNEHGSYFKKGYIELNGTEALAFARERKSLEDGDFDRGRNHIAVITGMINKAMSPSILFNYNDVLGVVLESTQTNMPKSKIVELVNKQIEDNSKWRISSQDAKGEDAFGLPSYAMPGWDLFMYELDQDSVDQLSQKMHDVLEEVSNER